jgi:hypothetical protein
MNQRGGGKLAVKNRYRCALLFGGTRYRAPSTGGFVVKVQDAAGEATLEVTVHPVSQFLSALLVVEFRQSLLDLPGGMLTVKTSKTGGDVEIPIFGPLRDVLTTRRGKGLVFPEAAALLKENPDALTWRFKKVVARALDDNAPEELPVRIPAVEVEQEGLAPIREHVAEGPRRDRMESILRRYAAGASIRKIEKAIGCRRDVPEDRTAQSQPRVRREFGGSASRTEQGEKAETLKC